MSELIFLYVFIAIIICIGNWSSNPKYIGKAFAQGVFWPLWAIMLLGKGLFRVFTEIWES